MLSELAMRILSVLEEFGHENVAAMLNTIIDSTGVTEEISTYQQALQDLVQADLVRMSIERDRSQRPAQASTNVSLDLIEGISSFLEFDREKKFWRDRRLTGPPFAEPFPYIVYTKAGKKKGIEILTERGYQWWVQKR
jgi:hypothetical protein